MHPHPHHQTIPPRPGQPSTGGSIRIARPETITSPNSRTAGRRTTARSEFVVSFNQDARIRSDAAGNPTRTHHATRARPRSTGAVTASAGPPWPP
ncbi:hypothetical protein GXW82_16790 [Streptacidiphilus sp. 4-A2]|nr:hypothetical protein [Streptacidiphilus sp. 4-A2]